MIDFKDVKKIYFVGIGGIGMSACAGLASAQGYDVSGSDSKDIYDPSKSVLDDHGIKYFIGYDSNNFQGADLLVSTAAEDDQNPEVAKAKSMGIPVIGYPELLNWLAKDKKQIVVVGTHGKGTTSGLLGFALQKLEDSGFFVGAVLSDLKTNFYWGNGPHFVIEGDEYKTSSDDKTPKFMYYRPNVLLINNIEFDHPDIYPDIKAFKKPFAELIEKLGKSDVVVFNQDDKNASDIAYGFTGKKIGFSAQARPEYKLPGVAYAYDYSAAICVLQQLGYEYENVKNIIAEYSGVKRRYEIVYDADVTIIDDYAHHPTAVKATLEATREKYPGRRIVCFFEPHTYSRTQETLAQLKVAFAPADLVYIAEVYPAREQKQESSITGNDVVRAVSESHPNVYFVSDKQDALQKYDLKKGDVVIVMAVGSFNTLSYDLARRAK
ncbi:hypothetical protein KGQ24_01935 [Patescibacteria group bacterium]|nr:hypothetical protein [Patescibacteria group bacterium]